MEEKRSDIFVKEWQPIYFIMPVFETLPQMPTLEAFVEALSKKVGKVEPLSENPKMPETAEELLGLALEEHLSHFEKENVTMPSKLMIYGADEFDRELWDDGIIVQFWDCGDARVEFANRCRYSIMASNMMATMLPMEEQYRLMADYADVLLELFPDCIGIYWPHSQRLVLREAYLQQNWNSSNLHFLDGGLHIRFFNISGKNEMLFDTLGFTAIGLPDLQVHCKELDPNEVVAFLRNLGAYLYQNGDVIEDGNTVEGIDQGKWVCQREER